MATLPTVPSFFAGDSEISKLQELSYAVAFLADCDVRPMFHVFKRASSQTLTANTWTRVSGGTVAFDSDNLFSAGAAFLVTINTPGYYSFEGCCGFRTATTVSTIKLSFLFTAGTSNPGFTAGAVQRFSARGGSGTVTTGNDTTINVSAMAPMALYPGDTVELQARSSISVDVSLNDDNSFISGRFVPNFTGYMIRAILGTAGIDTTSNILDQGFSAILDQAGGAITT